MSVLKANRKPSPFEVEHYAYKIRTVITDLALRKFGLKEYTEKPKPEAYSKWNQQQKDGYDKSVAKNRERYEAFIEWFIPDEMIVHEQNLIKGWRKSDNKVRKKILEKELTGQLTESKLRKSYNLLKELWVTIITPDLSTL